MGATTVFPAEVAAEQYSIWRRELISTESLDREKIAHLLRQIYHGAQLPPPERVIYLSSPLAGALAVSILRSTHIDDYADRYIGPPVQQAVRKAIGQIRIWNDLADVCTLNRTTTSFEVQRQSCSYFLPNAWNYPKELAFTEQTWLRFLADFQPQLSAREWGKIEAQKISPPQFQYGVILQWVATALERTAPSLFDAGWLQYTPLEQWFKSQGINTRLLEDLRSCAGQTGLWWPLKNCCVVVERPSLIGTNERGLLHSDRGPAARYSDGFEIYALRGRSVTVPTNSWARHGMTVEGIAREENVEARREMIEIYRIGQYISDCGATVVDKSRFGTLLRMDLPQDEPILMLQVTNATREIDGTFKQYFIRVPPNLTRAREAVAWTFKVREMEYDPAVES